MTDRDHGDTGLVVVGIACGVAFVVVMTAMAIVGIRESEHRDDCRSSGRVVEWTGNEWRCVAP